MKKLILALGLGFALASPASAQWGVRTWGYSTVPSYGYGGPPVGGVYVPQVPSVGGGCRFIPNPWERERCRQHRDWQRGW